MLEREIAFYEKHKPDLLVHHEGQYVLIHGDALLGAFSTEQLAYEAAVSRIGNEAVLIRLVQAGPETPDAAPALFAGYSR